MSKESGNRLKLPLCNYTILVAIKRSVKKSVSKIVIFKYTLKGVNILENVEDEGLKRY